MRETTTNNYAREISNKSYKKKTKCYHCKKIKQKA